MPVSTRVSGAWRPVTAAFVRVSGTWRQAVQMYVRVAGVWQELFGWLLGSGTYSGDKFDASSRMNTFERSLDVSDDGRTWYLVDTDQVFQYTTPTPWDVPSLSFDYETVFDPSEAGPSIQCAKLHPDGTSIYVMYFFASSEPVAAALRRYTLGTAWDLASINYTASQDLPLEDETFRSFAFDGDGQELYLVSGFRQIHRYSLLSAYSLDNATYEGMVKDIDSDAGSARDIRFRPGGTQMFISNDRNTAEAGVVSFDLSTPFDPTTATATGERLDTSEQCTPWGVVFKPDGTQCAVFGASVGFPEDDVATVFVYNIS